MSIESQMEAARAILMNEWDETHKRCDFGDPVRGQGMRDGYYDGIAAGYLAALRGLFVEVKPEDGIIRDSVECWARINGMWYQGVYWKAADEIDFKSSSGLAYGSYARTRFDSVIRILSIPSPSDIFGRGE